MSEEISLETLKIKLADRKWRLNNLYYIRDDKGRKVLFKMNKTQEFLHDNMWFFTITAKARQLGITTFFSIFYLDQVLFREGVSAGIIAHRAEDMKRIFRNKVRFAWDNLHPWLRETVGEPNTDSANELIFPNGSSIFVSMTSRSQTLQFLHISEFGYICQKAPEKAEEIVTGAINSVHKGAMVSIESTAAGREGYFYKFAMDAEQMRKEGRPLTEFDFKIFFFPWWIDERYVMNEATFAFTREDKEYFHLLKEKHGIKLTEGQMRWYLKKKRLMGEKIFAEFPSTLDEAFSVSLEGAYFSKEMSRVYLQNRIRLIPILPEVLVDTYWDLGMNDSTVIVFVQQVGPIINFVDIYVNSGEGLAHYVDVLKQKKELYKIRYGKHVLPHDVEVTELNSAITRKQRLFDLGMLNIQVAPKSGVNDSIERVRAIFPRFFFDEERCKPLTEGLSNYRKEFDANLGVFKEKPRHDASGHIVDAVRMLALTYQEPVENTLDELKVGEASFF